MVKKKKVPKSKIKFYVWQLDEDKEAPSSYRLEIINVDGRSFRKINRLLTEEDNWRHSGGDNFGTCLYTKEFDSLYMMKKWAKAFILQYDYDIYYVNRYNKESCLRPKKAGRKAGSQSKIKNELTISQKNELLGFLNRNKNVLTQKTYRYTKFSRNAFFKMMIGEVQKIADVSYTNTEVEKLLASLNKTHIIPYKREYKKNNGQES